MTTTVFNERRRAALTQQQANTQARLERLRAEIRKFTARVETGSIVGDEEIRAAIEKVMRMGEAERRMMHDIERLNDKIGLA